MKNEIIENLERLTELEKIADEKENLYAADPMNAEKENSFDEAYKNEFNIYILVSNQIADMIGVKPIIARKMVKTEREKIINILTGNK